MSAPDKIEMAEAAHQLQRLPARQPADLRRSGSGREGRIDGIDVEGEIGRSVADDLARFRHCVSDPLLPTSSMSMMRMP